jgi:hypothetical protein
MAATYSLDVEAGATFSLEFEYKNDDGTLFDFTGWTAQAQIRQSPAADLTLELDVSIDSELSTITVTMTAEETAALVLPIYVWAMELTETATGKVIRLVEGSVRVSPEVVRAED